MPTMHFCTCRLNLSGQSFYIVQYERDSPVSWPEVQTLMAVHGDENVMDVVPVAIAEVNPINEKRRLASKYSWQAVESVFPGRAFRMELLMPGETVDLPRVSDDGIDRIYAQDPSEPDDEDNGDEVLGRDPPATPPIMRPGKHRPPQAPAEPPPAPLEG